MTKYLLLLLAASSFTQAATFNVSTTPELRAALSTAATNSEDDTINLADGTYMTSDDGGGAFEYLGQELNTLDILGGTDAANAILDGGAINKVLSLKVLISTDYRSPNIFKISNLTIQNGYSTTSGAGIFAGASLNVINSVIKNNTSDSNGAAIASDYSQRITIRNSTISNNIANSAAIYGHSIYIYNSIFDANATSGGANSGHVGGINQEWQGEMRIYNSIFTNQTGVTIRGNNNVQIYNSLFKGNINSRSDSYGIGTILLNRTGVYYIYNSIFDNETTIEISGNVGANLYLYNSYIDESKSGVTTIFKNNIYGVETGFTDEKLHDYRLSASSELIDAGTKDGTDFYSVSDIIGNQRISGGNVDIGPYEFSSTRPTINSITYNGIAKEQNELTFSVDYTLADARDINDVSYDFINNGNYASLNTYTYNTAGTYTIGVKVTDSEGEFSTTTTSVIIAELPFSEMTYEQKLIKAISPEYYDALLADIALEQTNATDSAKQYVQDNLAEFSLVTEAAQTLAVASAITTGLAKGKQYVQGNLTEFSLVTVATKDAAVASATSTGITIGENNVINNPVAYGLNIVVGLSKEGVSQLPSSWKMISIPEDVADLSIFDDAKIVWFFSNETQEWTGYSSNTNTVQQMEDNNIGIITSLSAGDGVFIEM